MKIDINKIRQEKSGPDQAGGGDRGGAHDRAAREAEEGRIVALLGGLTD